MTGRLKTLVVGVLPPLATFVVVIVVWDVVALWFRMPAYLLPRPGRVAAVAWEKGPELALATRVTAAGALAGLGLSTAGGCLVAFAFSQSSIIRRGLFPYAIFLQTIPIVAIAPLVIIWFGNGFASVVVVAFIISLFPIITSTTTGLLSVDPNLVDLFRVHGATRWQTLWRLRLPNAVPYLVTGVKTSCGLSVIGAIVGEFFAGYGGRAFGLGYLINQTKDQLKTDYLFAAIGASTLLGVALFATVSLVGDTILARWHVAAASDRLNSTSRS